MFEKIESFSYPSTDAKTLHTHAFQWWIATGFRVTETMQGQFNGQSASKWGLQREVIVTVRDQGGTAIVDLRMKANITTAGAVGGGLAAILLLPVAVVGGVYSYAKYEQDARDLMAAFWNSIGTVVQTAPIDHKEEVVATTAVPQEEVAAASTHVQAAPALSNEEKLSLLEDRLARGEISEETYISIKARM